MSPETSRLVVWVRLPVRPKKQEAKLVAPKAREAAAKQRVAARENRAREASKVEAARAVMKKHTTTLDGFPEVFSS